MKTVPEIIDLAIESIDNLPAALLHCKVLADGLKHEPFQRWVTNEIDGYPTRQTVPDYRKIRGRLGGDFERYLIDVTYDHVPVQTLGPDLHLLIETISLTQGVGPLAALPDDGTIAFSIPMEKDILALINAHFGTRGRFVSIHVKSAAGSIRPVLVAIQHKLVSLLSEMNQLFPTPESYTNPSDQEIAALTNSLQRIVQVGHANSVIISPSYVHVDQSNTVFQQISMGNWTQLEEFLARQNITEDKREEVRAILAKVENGDESQSTQQELKTWIEETSEQMTDGVGEVLKEATKKAATDTITEALKKYAPSLAKWAWIVGSGLV